MRWLMLKEVDREITKKEADNVAGNISNLYSAKIYIWKIDKKVFSWRPSLVGTHVK